MRTIPLGSTDSRVSVFCLGAMYFGTTTDEKTSFKLLDRYNEAGGTFIDSANIYAFWKPGFSGGESESLIGRWMKGRGNRARIFIASKVGFPYRDVPRGLKPELIVRECEKSLKRLSTDRIDLFYAHVDDRETPLEETMRAFDGLVKAGKVQYVGASNYAAWRLEQALWESRVNGLASYCCIQQKHTYLRPRPGASFAPQKCANHELFDLCRSMNVTPLAYSPLIQGSYTRAERPLPEQFQGPDTTARLAVLRAVAREIGATENQVVLLWMIQGNPPVIPLVTGSSEEQLAENLAALDLKLTEEQMKRLDEASA